MIKAQRIIDSARALVGTPWRHQGRDKNGVDCLGFMLLCARSAGVDLEAYAAYGTDRTDYGRRPTHELLEAVSAVAERIDKPIPGSAILVRWSPRRPPQHFALFTERGTIIHATSINPGGVIEVGYAAKWITRTHSIWKYPGVDYGV